MVWLAFALICALFGFVLIQRMKIHRLIDALKSTNKSLNETRQEVVSQGKTLQKLESSVLKLNRKI